MKILVTGAAGFIGMHTVRALLADGHHVVGIDNLNDYYPVRLKQARLQLLTGQAGFRFEPLDITDAAGLHSLFAHERFDAVIHLAAQAGVRHSLQQPDAYIQSNLVGFAQLLEACRHWPVSHLLYASSASVYGQHDKAPFAETDNTDQPLSLYAATKKANEGMAHAYAHLYGIPCTGLRFFTVYGPWGRPDMAPWLFTSAIIERRPITLFDHGQQQRDFTYIDDVVASILRLLPLPPKPDSGAPWRLLNVGNHQPVPLLQFIETLEQLIGQPAIKQLADRQAGDVPLTCADTRALAELTGFAPATSLPEGLARFVDWYRQHQATPIAS